jgi:hypothetical protein
MGATQSVANEALMARRSTHPLGVGGSACSHSKKIKTENFFSGRAGYELTQEI